MSAEQYDSISHGHNPPRLWSVIIIFLALAVFGEAIFAGAMLSGAPWAHTAHSVGAKILIAATILAGLIAIVTLRRIPRGKQLGWTLLSFAVVICLQSALGALTAKGSNLLWIHIPLGVALFGIAAHAAIANVRSR
jgi:heme A synthase